MNGENIWKCGRKVGWIVKRYGNYGRSKLNSEKIWKYGRKVSWIVKRYGKYGRNPSWKLNSGRKEVEWKRYGRRKVSWIVKRYGKYGRKCKLNSENGKYWKKVE